MSLAGTIKTWMMRRRMLRAGTSFEKRIIHARRFANDPPFLGAQWDAVRQGLQAAMGENEGHPEVWAALARAFSLVSSVCFVPGSMEGMAQDETEDNRLLFALVNIHAAMPLQLLSKQCDSATFLGILAEEESFMVTLLRTNYPDLLADFLSYKEDSERTFRAAAEQLGIRLPPG